MFELETKIPLVLDKGSLYFGIAHDGQQTYLSSGDKQIFTLNDNLVPVNQTPTYNNYHTICYDSVLKCLWGASLEQPNMIFRLSVNLEKVEPVSIGAESSEPANIDHVFYAATEGQLYVSIKNTVYAVTLNGALQKKFEIKSDMGRLEAICAYDHYALCISRYENERQLSIHEISNGILLDKQSLPVNFSIYSMVILQTPLNVLPLSLRILASSEDTGIEDSFMIDYKADLSFFCQYVAHPTSAAQAPSPADIQIQQLYGGSSPFPCPEANFSRCNPYGSDNCQPCCNCLPCSCQCCSDVIESIALAEASIAHILNAEGEKLQKAIACSTDISQLLCINESVLKTIIHCTHLEQTLYYKLEALLNSEFCNCKE